jgi:hypothetical protein
MIVISDEASKDLQSNNQRWLRLFLAHSINLVYARTYVYTVKQHKGVLSFLFKNGKSFSSNIDYICEKDLMILK